MYDSNDEITKLKESIYNDNLVLKKEKWKPLRIDGKKTLYDISSFARIRNRYTGKVRSYTNPTGDYTRLSITIDKIEHRLTLHRLVATHFCTIPKRYREQGLTFKDLVPNHKDGIKHHNASFNLEWITPQENTEHAWKSGLCDNIRGENSHLAKMNEKTAIEICELIMQKKNNSEISKITGVSKKSIQHIRSGECWKHITSKYEFPKLAEPKHYTISLETIHAICKDLEEKKYSDYELGRKHGVKREYVRDLRTHRRRTDITCDYNF